MISENTKFEKRHVLYCDILGFSRYSQSPFFDYDFCLHLFRQFDHMINDSKEEIDITKPDPITGQPHDYVVKPEIIYCSDSLIISTPANTIEAIWLCDAAAHIQNGLCTNGFMLRGAIATGMLYHSGNTIFGPAIVNAVESEKNIVHPVVAISKETLDSFYDVKSAEDKEIVQIRSNQLISTSNCDSPYVNPLGMLSIHVQHPPLHTQNMLQIEYWRRLITKGLQHQSNRIASKYIWMARHFNQSLCNKKSDIMPIEHCSLTTVSQSMP